VGGCITLKTAIEVTAEIAKIAEQVTQSFKIIHFLRDSLPRISRISRMEDPSFLIRAIREIRGCTSLVAAGRAVFFALFAVKLQLLDLGGF